MISLPDLVLSADGKPITSGNRLVELTRTQMPPSRNESIIPMNSRVHIKK